MSAKETQKLVKKKCTGTQWNWPNGPIHVTLQCSDSAGSTLSFSSTYVEVTVNDSICQNRALDVLELYVK